MRADIAKRAVCILLILLLTPFHSLAADNEPFADKSTFTYDFEKYNGDFKKSFGVSQTIDIDIQPSYDGYITFNATGYDPYFAFSDKTSPDKDATELAYVLIKYRTEASIGKGEFYTNRTDGKQWGADGTFFDFPYENDGKWHTVIADATKAWGNAENVRLYAFRFDPLASGAKAGDSIDIAYLKFFRTKADAEEYAEYDEALQKKREEAEGEINYIPLYRGSLPEGFEINGENTYIGPYFMRFTDSEAKFDITGNSERNYVRFLYRSEDKEAKVNITTPYGSAELDAYTGGLWKTAYAKLEGEKGDYEIKTNGGDIDIVSVAFTKTEDQLGLIKDDIYLDDHKYSYKNGAFVDLGAEYFIEASFISEFGEYSSDAAKRHGITADKAEISPIADKGYIEATVQGTSAIIFEDTNGSHLGAGDNVVIKYRAEKDMTAKVSFTSADKSISQEVRFTSGGWSILNIDLSNDAHVNDTIGRSRLDFSSDSSGKLDIAYIAYYSCQYAAELAIAADTDGDGSIKAPSAPKGPSDAEAVYILEGDGLNVPMSYGCDATQYDHSKGYITLTATNSDPNVNLALAGTEIAPYVIIKYRTECKNAVGEFFLSSVQSTPHGNTDHVKIPYQTDGLWHTAIVDLSTVSEYDAEKNTVKYFRFDFLQKDGLAFGSSIDIEYIAFFSDKALAEGYEHTAPERDGVYRVVFYSMGRKIYELEYIPGEEFTVPVVPIIKGMDGRWEDFELVESDIEVNAVYTPVNVDTGPVFDPTISEESDESDEGGSGNQNGNTLYIVIASVCGAVIIAAAAFVTVRSKGGKGK